MLLPSRALGAPLCFFHSEWAPRFALVRFPNCNSSTRHPVFPPDTPIVTVRRASVRSLRFSWSERREGSGCPSRQNLRVCVLSLLQVRCEPLPHYKAVPSQCPASSSFPPIPPPGSLHSTPQHRPQPLPGEGVPSCSPSLSWSVSSDSLAGPVGLSPEFFLSLPSSPRPCSRGYLTPPSTPLPSLSPPPHATPRSLLPFLAQPVLSLSPSSTSPPPCACVRAGTHAHAHTHIHIHTST